MNQEINLAQMQPIVYQQLQRSFEHGRIAHAYLFEGEKGTGKHEVGIWLAQHLFCTQMKDNLPCGKCNNCQRIEKKEHPDVLVIEPEGQTIKVDQIRRLQTEFSRSGYESRKKVFLIKEAEKMNSSAANSLLKFLEEPPGDFLPAEVDTHKLPSGDLTTPLTGSLNSIDLEILFFPFSITRTLFPAAANIFPSVTAMVFLLALSAPSMRKSSPLDGWNTLIPSLSRR